MIDLKRTIMFILANKGFKLWSLNGSYITTATHITEPGSLKIRKLTTILIHRLRPLLNSLVEVSSVPWTQLTIPPRQLKVLASHGSQGGAAAAGPVCFVTILIVSFCHSNLDQINLIELMNDTGNHKLLPRLYRHAVKRFDIVLLNLLHIVSFYCVIF